MDIFVPVMISSREYIWKEIKNYFITEKYIAKLEGKSISLEEKWKECFGLYNDD